MDALDDANPNLTDHEDKDGGEENVDADEREGNRDFVRQTESYENEEQEDEDDNNENDFQAQQHQNLQIEERMKRLKLSNEKSHEENYDTRHLSEAQRRQYPNISKEPSQDQYDTPGNRGGYTPNTDRYNESYQNFEEYGNMPNENYHNETQEPQPNHMLIMQYESVLQKVNSEFQKLLNKNKETEEELSMTKMQLEQVQRAYEEEAKRTSQNQGKSMRLLLNV
jgi:hypothetical protein